MGFELSSEKVQEVLDWAYEKAVNGFAGVDSAEELARSYMRSSESKVEQMNSLIRWQNTKAAGSGFVTGLGGIITLPVTIPANLASVLFVQIRMIAAIAYIGGYDIRNDRVRSLIYLCLIGNSAKDVLKDIGVAVGNRLAANAVKNISGKTITKINQAVGMKLFTKAGTTGLINLGKAVPLVGGIIGGTFDAVTTNMVGNVARDAFSVEPDFELQRNEVKKS